MTLDGLGRLCIFTWNIFGDFFEDHCLVNSGLNLKEVQLYQNVQEETIETIENVQVSNV